MGFDIGGVRRAAVALSGKTAELNALKAALRSYQSGINAAWQGPEAARILSAIDAIIAKIDHANRLIVSGAHGMNGAAAAKAAEEAAAKADASMNSIW